MTSTLTEKAVVGRRIAFTYYRDLKRPNPPEHPGIITELVPDQGASLRIRLDGQRTSLHTLPDYKGLRYLDEVITPVPELPMGRFHPSTTGLGFDFQYDGVRVCGFEDGDAVAVTADQSKAEAAVATFLREVEGIDDEGMVRDCISYMKPRWVVFEWEPEDAECVWLMNPASEGDDQAVHVYYLPV